MLPPILIVTGDFGKHGGMDWANREVARYFAEKGHPVHLVGFTCDNELTQRPNIQFHPVAKPLGSYFLGFFLLDIVGRRWAAKIASKGGRVIVNGGNCGWSDINWVHYLHAANEVQNRVNSRWNRWRQSWFKNRELAIITKAATVITTAHTNETDLQRFLSVEPDKIHVIPLGIDGNIFAPPSHEDRAQLRKNWDLEANELVVCFIGELNDDRKGFDTLYQSWKVHQQSQAAAKVLLVAGSGSKLQEWKQQAIKDKLNSSIRFLGFTKKVPDLLKIADAIFIPSRYEPYSLVAQEAVASGISCFISEGAGFSQLFPKELRELFVLDPLNQEDWTDSLKKWSVDPVYYSEKIKDFSQKIRDYTWDKMAENIYGLLCSQTRSPTSAKIQRDANRLL